MAATDPLGLFLAFARIGTFAFGGGPSMLPVMKTECVDNGFVTEAQFMDAVALGNTLPGPIATKLAVYVGWHHGGAAGVAAAMVGLLLPSSLMMAVIAGLMTRFSDHWAVQAALRGARPALIGMLFYTAVELAPGGVTGLAGVAIAIAAFAALIAEVHPAIVLVGGLALGVLVYR